MTDEINKKIGFPSSKLLLRFKKPVTANLSLPDGSKKIVKIPAPSWFDKRWAKKIENYSWQARQEALSAAIDKNNIWRVAYLLSQDEERKRQKKEEQLLNLDGLINLSDGSGYWGIIAKSIQREQISMAIMFIAAGADPERIPPGEPQRRAILIAIKGNKVDMVEILATAGAEICSSYTKYAPSSQMKKLLAKKINTIPNNVEVKILNEDNKKANKVSWEKMDNHIISKTIESRKSRIQMIFNFQASRITHLHETLDEKIEGRVVHRHSPVIEYFHSVQNSSEIEDAFNKLVEMGGKPDMKAKNKNYRTIRKISNNKKI